MVIRLNNKLAEVDTIEYISKIVAGKHCTNVRIDGYSAEEVNRVMNEKYTNIINTKTASPDFYGPAGGFKYIAVFDADEKETKTGLSFTRNNEEILFYICDQETADGLLDEVATSKYLDLRTR